MKIAVISAILEKPSKCNSDFNQVVSTFRGSIKGRMGIPLDDETSVISIVVVGSLNEINSLTGRLGNIEGVTVKTAISKKETMLSNNVNWVISNYIVNYTF